MPACKEMLVELFIMTFGFISLVVQLGILKCGSTSKVCCYEEVKESK